MNCMYHRDRE